MVQCMELSYRVGRHDAKQRVRFGDQWRQANDIQPHNKDTYQYIMHGNMTVKRD